MDKVDFFEINSLGEIITHAFITKDDGTWVSMLKSTYDAQVEHLTEKVTDEAPNV